MNQSRYATMGGDLRLSATGCASRESAQTTQLCLTPAAPTTTMENPLRTDAASQHRILFVGAAILLCLWLAYTVAIDRFPPFIDEMIHVHGSEQGFEISPLENVDLGRQFTIWWMMLFQAHREAPLWISRVTTVLTGMLAAAAVMGIGRLAARLWGATLAGLLYLFSAYNFFFGRLALADPISGAAVLVAIYVAYRLTRRAHMGDALLAGFCLFLAVGAKVSALPYLGIILAAALTLRPAGRPWGSQLRWAIAAFVTAAVLIGGMIGGFRLLGHDFFSNSVSYALTNRGGTPLTTLLDVHRIAANAGFTLEILAGYLGAVPMLLALVAVLILALRRRLYLPLCLIGPLAVVWANQIQESRYLFVPSVLLLLCAALVLARIIRVSGGPLVRAAILLLVAAWGLVWWLPFVGAGATDPALLPLPEADIRQYLASDASGYMLEDVLLALRLREPERVIGLLANCQGLRYLALGDFPVECPVLSPDGSRIDELAKLMEQNRAAGVYVVLESLPYVPATSPGRLITTVWRLNNSASLSIYDLSPGISP